MIKNNTFVSFFPSRYANFRVYSEAENYKLETSGYSGTAGDALDYHRSSFITIELT